jgi:hypothetical protein
MHSSKRKKIIIPFGMANACLQGAYRVSGSIKITADNIIIDFSECGLIGPGGKFKGRYLLPIQKKNAKSALFSHTYDSKVLKLMVWRLPLGRTLLSGVGSLSNSSTASS